MNLHKALCLVLIPIALGLGGSPAAAKKKKKKPPAEAAAPEETSPKAATPAADAATPDTASKETPAAAASVSASVSVTASTQPATATATPGDPATPPTAAPAAAPTAAPAAPAPEQRRDGVRFRGGISIGGGGEFVSGFTAGLGGIDGRLGVQINHLVGVYIQPHVAFGAGTIGNISGATGNFAATANADFTFIHRIFVGAGAGFGVTNAPYGAVVQLRLGGYPVMKFSESRPRRKGLMVGADFRTYIVGNGSAFIPIVNVMASVGYEAF